MGRTIARHAGSVLNEPDRFLERTMTDLKNLLPAAGPRSGSRRHRGTPRPRWYLWEGGFLVVAQAGGEVPAHSHHAIQIFLAVDGAGADPATRAANGAGQGIIVRPDVEHSFNARGATGALLFVDPESSEGDGCNPC